MRAGAPAVLRAERWAHVRAHPTYPPPRLLLPCRINPIAYTLYGEPGAGSVWYLQGCASGQAAAPPHPMGAMAGRPTRRIP